MPINRVVTMFNMPVPALRAFRLSAVVTLALAIAYASAMPLPFLAPIMGLLLAVKPAPAITFKALIALVIVVCISLGIGVLLVPLLLQYPLSAIMMVAFGLYFSTYITVILGKALLGILLTIGFTMISAAGLVNHVLAITVIQGFCSAIAIAVLCQWLVYPLFPNVLTKADVIAAKTKPELPENSQTSNWIALRSTLIVLPTYLLTLTNPLMYMAIIMKAVTLGQQGSTMSAKDAGKELLGSTFLAGCFAILFWFLLDLSTNLFMFSAWLLLFSLYFVSKIYRILPSRFSASFWQNTFVTMLIVLGPAVEDSANGKDVYAAFAVRMGLFIMVTLYACLAIYGLEHLKNKFVKAPHLS
ncbi:DUF2955 domain-containing protein [Thalassotalea atypica]|uniref:DUF2955 domain-containing protein n=1 Tax=Thalassotalea atypica TaxID=2054316 RepID=UPI0025728A44|nr:DUF2955 domain-containing protein [Thalassotalea atypica]